MRNGRLVAVVGPDGAGKTTLANTMLTSYDGPTGYIHFRPPIAGSLLAVPPPNPRLIPKVVEAVGNRPLGWGRLFYNLLRFWLGYVTSIRPRLKEGMLIVADRWCYGYLAQPTALRYYGPAWLARLVVAAFPRPSLVVNLVAPVGDIAARKQELSPSEIEKELAAWQRLPVAGRLDLDATQPPELMARRVLETLL